MKREKYNLIKAIKENFNIDEFFSARIPNYRIYASIYKTFLVESSAEDFDPTDSVNNKYVILEYITKPAKKEKKSTKSDALTEYLKQDKDLQIITYQLLVKKFNDKYGGLNENQQHLLREYIANMANTRKLREFVDMEIVKIKKVLKSYLPKIQNKVTKIKLQESIVQIDKLPKSKLVQDKQVISLLRYYALCEELKKVCNG